MNMDVNKIFDLFSGGREGDGDYTQQELEDLRKMEEFKESPMFKVGMFKKLIFNHLAYKDRIIDLFKNVKPNLNIYELEEAGETITFERGWEFISQCEIDKEEWQQCLILYNDEEIKVALRLSINFFQELEEYEKCAYLKKILDFCEKSLAVPE
jgi:hypothetical protein|tara:strand:- start:66 stop:527 length:462 start_codon:yes stop_codon:yes gene_type:complete